MPLSPLLPNPDLFIGPHDPRLAASQSNVESSNNAHFFAFQVRRPVTVSKACIMPGAASGNCDVGIYTLAGGTATRIASTGATAVGSAFSIQKINLTAAVTLVPGVTYWAALAADNTTASFDRGLASGMWLANGLAAPINCQFGSSYPLPSTLGSFPSGTISSRQFLICFE